MLFVTKLAANSKFTVGIPGACQAMAWMDFQPGHCLSLFALCSGQLSGLWRTNVLQWGQRAFCFRGFLVCSVPIPVPVGGCLLPLGGVFSLSCCAVCFSPPPAIIAFILSIIASMLALFVAVIPTICLSCCSCSIANNMACDSPSSSAAAVSWARSAASLNHDCFAVVAEYCLRSSHFLVKNAWSAVHVCCAAVLFSHETICWVRRRYCLAGITKLGERVAKNTKLG